MYLRRHQTKTSTPRLSWCILYVLCVDDTRSNTNTKIVNSITSRRSRSFELIWYQTHLTPKTKRLQHPSCLHILRPRQCRDV